MNIITECDFIYLTGPGFDSEFYQFIAFPWQEITFSWDTFHWPRFNSRNKIRISNGSIIWRKYHNLWIETWFQVNVHVLVQNDERCIVDLFINWCISDDGIKRINKHTDEGRLWTCKGVKKLFNNNNLMLIIKWCWTWIYIVELWEWIFILKHCNISTFTSSLQFYHIIIMACGNFIYMALLAFVLSICALQGMYTRIYSLMNSLLLNSGVWCLLD